MDIATKTEETYNYGELAESAHKKKDYKTALRYWELALEQEPDRVDYSVDISETLLELQKFKDAIKHARKACQLHPSSNNYFHLSHVYFMADDNKNALKFIDKALKLSPKDTTYHSSKATICSSYGDLEKAIYHAKYVNEREPYNNHALSQLAKLYENNNNLEEAFSCVETLIAREPNNKYYRLQYDSINKKIGFIQRVKQDNEIEIEIIQNSIYILEFSKGERYIQGSGFYVQVAGLVTSYHVTDSGEFYNIFTADSYYEDLSLGMISKELNEKASDKTIDYAVYDINPVGATDLKIGDSTCLKIGDIIIVAGYPNFQKGDSITKQSCEIVGITSLFGAPFYKVSGRIVHGASGGVVFNTNYEVVGIIKGGIASLDEEDSNDQQGFVPIHLVMDDFHKKTATASK